MDWIKQVDWNTTAQWVAIGVLFLTWLLTWLAQRRARYGIYRQELYRQRMLLYRRIWQLLTDIHSQPMNSTDMKRLRLPAWERLRACLKKNVLFIEESVSRATWDFIFAWIADPFISDDLDTAIEKVEVAMQRALALEPLSKELQELTTAPVEASKARPAGGSPGRGDLGGEG